MPTYLYYDGDHEWDVVKRIADIDNPETCPDCGKPGQRQLCAPAVDRIAAAGWNEQTQHPALGCYTRSTQHARQIAKRRGLEEVGTESPEKIHAKFERDKEETRARRWAEADREKVYE